MAPEDMRHAVEKGTQGNVMVAERGTSFGYHDLIVDYRGIPDMRSFAPVIFDATHAVQKPGGAGGASGGARQYIEPLARAALAVGVDGLFLETHPNPEAAISDKQTQIPLSQLAALAEDLSKFYLRIADTPTIH